MAKKGPSKAEQRRAKRRAQSKAARRAKPKPKPKPRRRTKSRRPRGRGALRRTVGGVRRVLGLGRRATTSAVRRVPRRDRLRARRRRARNHLLAAAALVVATYVLLTSLSAPSVVVWLAALALFVVVLRKPLPGASKTGR